VFFRQVLHEDLGCASYLIADGGDAVVVDPKWEVEDYDLRIAYVLETHDHADHVSGRARLAGAEVVKAELLELGSVRIRALPTPGHRPEHFAYLVEDASRAGEPWLVLTGDSLFVGDVARPDLALDPEAGARGLFTSLRRLLELPDWVEVWPGHLGGSLCGGGGTSDKSSSTIGFERRFNRFLQIEDEGEFVRELTAQRTPQPPNFERIVELNRHGPPAEAVMLEPVATVDGATVIDGRSPREFDAAHVPGSINVTMTEPAVGTRAAWVLDLEEPLILAAASDADAERLGRLLEAVGFQNLRGYLAGGIAAVEQTESTPAIDAETAARLVEGGELTLLDVREDDEWEEGHVEDSLHVPYHELADGSARELAGRGPLAVACSAGNRSSIAASLLKRAGIDDVVHVAEGGVDEIRDLTDGG
jgi:rhodanese-related sulfurtransferase/glyoxylase-like metal-dependent hydrolase (beta-lactamase superfamily II)